MKYFSLFSGIGGFERGIEDARVKWECVGYSEIDKHAIKVYKQHYPNHRNYGDATKIDTQKLPAFDLLCAGFPCQSFSLIGKRRGFQDTRGTLFFEICRITGAKRPRYLFLENVKGLLSHDGGQTFQTILESLGKLGYDIQWQVLNSNYWLPQARERTFIVCNLREAPKPCLFPIMEECEGDNGMDGEIPNAPTLTASYSANSYGAGRPYVIHERLVGDRPSKEVSNNVPSEEQEHQVGKGLRKVVDSPRIQGIPNAIRGTQDRLRLPQTEGGNILGQLLLAQMPPPLQSTKKKLPVLGTENPQEPRERQEDINGIGIAGLDSVKNMATRLEGWFSPIRALTPEEFEQLQGFPIGWTKDVKDKYRYECLENAVTTKVIRDIVVRWIGGNNESLKEE